MSTTPTTPIVDDNETTSSPTSRTHESLDYIITHVFLPVHLPDENYYPSEKNLSLARAVSAAADAYNAHVRGTSEGPKWDRIARMLDNLQASAAAQSEGSDRDHVVSQLHGMETGDIIPFFSPHSSSKFAILTRRENYTLFESFDAFLDGGAVMRTAGRLICSYPQFAFKIENEIFNDENFQLKLAEILCPPHIVNSDLSPPLPAIANSIATLRSGFASSRASSYSADVPLITKHIRDEVGTGIAGAEVWRRSPLWLIIRVATQMSLDRSSLGRASYKTFMVFFLCTIASNSSVATLSTDRLHLMAGKILRRSTKLGSSIPDWLLRMALKTCADLQEILDARWERSSASPSSFRNPSQDDLRRDTQLSLKDGYEYICNALANDGHEYIHPPFHPNHRRRGTIDDFLSSNGVFFDEAYDADCEVTLYDVERSVEQGLDDWVANVTDVDEACTQLAILMGKYMSRAHYNSPEDISIIKLTSIEIFIAIDNLVMKDIPMLADYSPEISVAALERLLLLRTETSVHRFSHVYQYLSARQSQSRPGWSVFSDDFTKDSFPVRYYDQSSYHQQLKARIEEETMSHGNSDSLLLPSLSLHAKVVVFELQCPACIRAWRSAVARILDCFSPVEDPNIRDFTSMESLLKLAPLLQPYSFDHDAQPFSRRVELGYFHDRWSPVQTPLELHYALRGYSDGPLYVWREYQDRREALELSYPSRLFYEQPCSSCSPYEEPCSSCKVLGGYVNSTSHTANDVLAAQAICPTDLSLDEFIAFGQLRSGGSLQWLNILQGLRKDVGALISCSLLIHALESRLDYAPEPFLLRDRRLSVALEEVSKDVILADASNYGVDLAVLNIFPSHKPNTHKWEGLQGPNARWLACRTKAMAGYPSKTVHLNLLDGMLLVDGQPLGGLPHVIRDNPECRHIFHDQGFFVIPSNIPGMDFTTLAMTSKYKVHFSLRGDNDLVVRAQCDESKDILELIPSRILEKDLPSALLDGHVHWLDLSTKVLEMRPLERLWVKSAENWRIDCTSRQYRIYKGNETLVGTHSPTWAMVSKCFERLNVADEHSPHSDVSSVRNPSTNLIITTSPIEFLHTTPALRLSIILPRHGLSFFVNAQGELESRDFKHMVYDENQCVGALMGLKNMLALRQRTDLPEGLIPGCVLIPNGRPRKDDDGQVMFETGYNSRYITPGEPLYHIYNMDTELGCLVGNGSPASWIYLAELHHMTSYDRPDPLTRKTGAQAALCILQSGGCRSIMKRKAPGDMYSWPYPQIKAAHQKIRRCYYWDHDSSETEIWLENRTERAALRAAYLFPWHDTGLASGKDLDHDGNGSSTTCAPIEPVSHVLHHIYVEQTPWPITLQQLFSDRAAPELPSRSTLPRDRHKRSAVDITGLNQLFSTLTMNKSSASFQQRYISLLEESARRVREHSGSTHTLVERNHIDMLQNHYTQCRVIYFDALCILRESLGPTINSHEQALEQFGQWPPVTADFLLRCLASTSPIHLSVEWKKCLVSLALRLLDLQRARRLLRFTLDGLEQEFSKELENEGCEGWDPEEYPDWLLIQIQGNFLIRESQAEIAMEIISPKTRRNTVLQVNMGEGKSSVIIPIAASVLADGKQLVRVIVPKFLTAQMFDLLVARLGGLANRPIYHLPFSRSSEFDEQGRVISLQCDDLLKLMSQCMAERGILLVQPEHVVSLKLMCIGEQIHGGKCMAEPLSKVPKSLYKRVTASLLLKSLRENSFISNMFQRLPVSANYPNRKGAARGDINNSLDSATNWLNLQKWMDSHVRDILDESDEVLHPRFQLIYTIGLEQYMDGYPDRWTITQQVLRLAKECAHALSDNHPNSMDYISNLT